METAPVADELDRATGDPMRAAQDVTGQDAGLHYRGPYFVMCAGQPKKPDGHVYVFGDGCTLKQAHISAESHYRKERNLASSVFVQTEKLAECGTFEQAEQFVEKLNKVMMEATEQ